MRHKKLNILERKQNYVKSDDMHYTDGRLVYKSFISYSFEETFQILKSKNKIAEEILLVMFKYND